MLFQGEAATTRRVARMSGRTFGAVLFGVLSFFLHTRAGVRVHRPTTRQARRLEPDQVEEMERTYACFREFMRMSAFVLAGTLMRLVAPCKST
eukprot:6207143-Pleurochrysis_carterae.AAC.1